MNIKKKYGESILGGARRIWNSLVLLEDLLHSEWPVINKRRCDLIDKESLGYISDDEMLELDGLNEYTDRYSERFFPGPSDKEMEEALEQRKKDMEELEKFFSRPKGILEDLEDKVSEWHESDSELSLHEWLGMDTEEYNCYLKGEENWLTSKGLTNKEIEEALEQGRKDREEFEKYNQTGGIDPSIRFRS